MSALDGTCMWCRQRVQWDSYMVMWRTVADGSRTCGPHGMWHMPERPLTDRPVSSGTPTAGDKS